MTIIAPYPMLPPHFSTHCFCQACKAMITVDSEQSSPLPGAVISSLEHVELSAAVRSDAQAQWLYGWQVSKPQDIPMHQECQGGPRLPTRVVSEGRGMADSPATYFSSSIPTHYSWTHTYTLFLHLSISHTLSFSIAFSHTLSLPWTTYLLRPRKARVPHTAQWMTGNAGMAITIRNTFSPHSGGRMMLTYTFYIQDQLRLLLSLTSSSLNSCWLLFVTFNFWLLCHLSLLHNSEVVVPLSPGWV